MEARGMTLSFFKKKFYNLSWNLYLHISFTISEISNGVFPISCGIFYYLDTHSENTDLTSILACIPLFHFSCLMAKIFHLGF